MRIFIILLIVLVLIIVIARLCIVFKDKINFYTTGFDSAFKLREINTLWKLAKQCKLEDPMTLYYSVPVVNKCIAAVITEARANGTHDSAGVQLFLDKLYKYRTRIALDSEGKKGLDSTKYLDVGQKVTVLFPGKGVFMSKIVGNGRELILELPKRFDKKTQSTVMVEGGEWIGREITVYFWRKNDAMYSIVTPVLDAGVYMGKSSLFLKHTNELVRTQKRQSVRSDCEIYAMMYMIKDAVTDFSKVSTEGGYKCLLEDISEDGALIRIGGKGVSNVQIKLQFTIEETFVMMYGLVKGVEFNPEINQSRLHFECKHIDPAMKNAILTYVYKVIPDEEKEIQEAIVMTEGFKASSDAASQMAQSETEEKSGASSSGDGIIDSGDNSADYSMGNGGDGYSSDPVTMLPEFDENREDDLNFTGGEFDL